LKEKVISVEITPGGWSGTPRMVQKTGSWRTLRPLVDMTKCTGCGLCNSFCPEASIKMVERKAVINYDYCKGCGVCWNECPTKAIQMVPEVGGS
jgi:pyruvate ferredoxin oxidoreductase delta subunit